MGRLKPGKPAPVFNAPSLDGEVIDLEEFHDGIILLSFFRYASCPLCNLRVQELIREYDTLAANRVSVIAVFQSPAERINRYVGQQAPPFPLIPDPQTRLYRLYNVESSWIGFIRAWSIGLPKIIQAVLGKHFLPGTVEGDLNRIPADFLISPNGTLIDVHYGIDIGDHMPLERIYDILEDRKHYQPS